MTEAATPKGALALGVTKRGYGMRFALETHRELSTRAGRRFAKPAEGDEVVGVALVGQAKHEELVCAVTSDAHAILCRVEEIPELANPGRGVTVIKTDPAHPVMGFGVGTRRDREMLYAELDAGKKLPLGPETLSVTSRGGKGHAVKRKAKVLRVTLPEPPPPPTLLN
jgi:DNA gyrase subunit A